MGNVVVVAVRDWDAAEDKEAAEANKGGNNVQGSVAAENMTSKLDFPGTSSTELNKTQLTEKQKYSQFFYGTRAAKLNEAFLICACISLFIITMSMTIIFFK